MPTLPSPTQGSKEEIPATKIWLLAKQDFGDHAAQQGSHWAHLNHEPANGKI